MKQILLSAVFLLGFQLANAQSKLELGLEAGPNATSVHTSSYIGNVANDYNYVFGFAAQYNISPGFSIKTCLNDELKGYSINYTFLNDPKSRFPYVTYTNHVGLGYITIPILAKISFGKRIKFFANGGPYFGYRAGSRSRFVYSDSIGNTQLSSSQISDNFKTIDFGAVAGAGLEVPLSKLMTLDFEIRYNAGFYNISTMENARIENYSTDFLLGLRYKI